MESFQELGLPAFLDQSLKQMNFSKPTPVQAQAIPSALAGKDIIASAQTGTGKTAAFGIPLLNYLETQKGKTAMVLTPTRELAVQVLEVLRQLTGKHFLGGSVLLIGGANMGAQLSGLNRKPRLFIGTPGRIIDHLNRGSLSLAQTGFLVLDEADRMLDMGFAPQLEEIRKRLPAERQTLLFSATIPPNIQAMGSRYLKDPVRITVGSTTQPVPKIVQMIIHTSEAKKPEELVLELKERHGSSLVFARTQHRVDRIAERLKDQGFKVTRIHGGRTQSQRKQAIDQFREGHYDVLVATDIAARGLDIHHIAHVINYDLPRNPEDYVHRVGRTARAGAEGASLCFLTAEDRDLWGRITRLTGATKDSIQVKASKFGDFTPKEPVPTYRVIPQKEHRPGGQPHRRPQGAGGGHPSKPGFKFQRQDDFQKRRHPDGRHSQRSEHHHRDGGPHRPHGGHSNRSSHREGFIFHGHQDDQPGQNDTREWKPKEDNFLQRLGQTLAGRFTPKRGGRTFQGRHPGDRRDDRRPQDGHRPHRHQDQRPGNFHPRHGRRDHGPGGPKPRHFN